MADDKYTRVIPLEDKLLNSMVVQKGELVEQGRTLARQIEDVSAQLEKLTDDATALASTVNNKKLDILKRLRKVAKGLLTEYEIPVTTEIRDGQLVMLATEALQEFKESFANFDKWREPVPRKKK